MKSVAEYLLTAGISALVMSVVLVACGSTSAIKPSRTAEAVVASPVPQHDVATAADLSDAESGQLLAQVTTAKNSWALGGGFAAAQTVDSFMQGAAGKIAADLRDSKRGTSVVKAKSNP